MNIPILFFPSFQFMVPNIQKLVNQGGGVVTDIFAPCHVRPPVSAMVIPLLCGEGGEAEPGKPLERRRQLCYGAVYCMSSVPADFSDVDVRLKEAVAEVRVRLRAVAEEPH